MSRERPILFSGPMVRAILDGHKTQTRRVVKPQPNGGPRAEMVDLGGAWALSDGCLTGEWRCPYGVPGDRLWVRETWQEFFEDELPGRERGPRGRAGIPAEPHRLSYVYYRADGEIEEHPEWGKAIWMPSIHMPRWASRISLEVTDVRVQRLQDISEEDAAAEGMRWEEPTAADMQWAVERYGEDDAVMEGVWIAPGTDNGFSPKGMREKRATTARDAFRFAWNHLNDDRGHGWDANPWVWAITFQRLGGQAVSARAPQATPASLTVARTVAVTAPVVEDTTGGRR